MLGNPSCYRPGLPPIPDRLLRRPVDHRGYPVPWFITKKDAEERWDFRTTGPRCIREAHEKQLCWVCGQPMGNRHAFVSGPLILLNRTNWEPPSHLDCGRFAVQACPFLMLPAAQRRTANLDPGVASGEHNVGPSIRDNPGVACLWAMTQRDYKMNQSPQGIIFVIKPRVTGDVTVWARGQKATTGEVLQGLTITIDGLLALARQHGQNLFGELVAAIPDALMQISRQGVIEGDPGRYIADLIGRCRAG